MCVLGIHSGTKKHLTAVNWPIDNTRYIIATDHDEAGDRYARDIRDALPSRAESLRLTVEEIYALREENNIAQR
jgi:hypothetical protein